MRAPDRRDEATPLRDFEWSDGIVGMGYFPDEVALPAEWTWTGEDAASPTRRATPRRA